MTSPPREEPIITTYYTTLENAAGPCEEEEKGLL
jgi:hypothetical protein